jgi:hypothetical protein
MKNMDEMKKKEKMEKRKAALVEAGFDLEDVEAALASFDVLEDEAFESVVAMYGKKKAKKEDEAEAGMPPEVKEAIEKKKKEKEAKAEEEEEEETTPSTEAQKTLESDAAEAELSAEAFENLETSEAAIVEATQVDELDTARASVADWFTNHVLNK